MARNDNDNELDAPLREVVERYAHRSNQPNPENLIAALKLTLARACAMLGKEGLDCGYCALHRDVRTESRPGFVLQCGVFGDPSLVDCGGILLAMDDEEEHDRWICPKCHLSMDSSSIELGDFTVREIPNELTTLTPSRSDDG